jgi:hypothetical protein
MLYRIARLSCDDITLLAVMSRPAACSARSGQAPLSDIRKGVVPCDTKGRTLSASNKMDS